jgi:hypothetical protein
MIGDRSRCRDCDLDTVWAGMPNGPWEYYMVHDHVWAQTGLGPYDGMLCVGCIEFRLGRRLTPEDFTDAPVNDFLEVDSPRLRSRKQEPAGRSSPTRVISRSK